MSDDVQESFGMTELTAHTITAEMILRLRDDARREGRPDLEMACERAMRDPTSIRTLAAAAQRLAARITCADELNHRARGWRGRSGHAELLHALFPPETMVRRESRAAIENASVISVGGSMVNRATRLQGAGETHRGNIRLTNEDSLIVEPELGLFAVLDGMGGYKGGAIASQLARDTILEFVQRNARRHDLPPFLVLQDAIREASAAVFRARHEREKFASMGTTVVACLAVQPPGIGEPARVIVSHVGDSRAYRLHAGGLEQLTRDHTVVQQLIDDGSLTTQEEIDRCNLKHVLTRSLGRDNDAHDVVEVELAPGDRLLLCSDGLHTSAPAEELRRVLASENTPARIATQLIDLALSKGDDNISAVVIAAPG